MIKSFVVRVYRRDPEDATRLTGTVEDVEHGQKAVFHNIRELWSLIGDEPAQQKPDAVAGIVEHLGARRRTTSA